MNCNAAYYLNTIIQDYNPHISTKIFKVTVSYAKQPALSKIVMNTKDGRRF
jgi:hypothetical protein